MPPTRRKTRTSSSVEAVRPSGGSAILAPPPLAKGESARVPARAVQLSTRTGLEMAAWAAIVAVAIGVRALNLDAAPLLATESSVALDSWQIVEHTGLAIGASPLLVYLNALLFLSVGATDVFVKGEKVATIPVVHAFGELGLRTAL